MWGCFGLCDMKTFGRLRLQNNLSLNKKEHEHNKMFSVEQDFPHQTAESNIRPTDKWPETTWKDLIYSEMSAACKPAPTKPLTAEIN